MGTWPKQAVAFECLTLTQFEHWLLKITALASISIKEVAFLAPTLYFILYSRNADKSENECEVGNRTNGKKTQIGQHVSMLADVC